VNCSKYFHIDENNDVKPNHDCEKYINQCGEEKNTEQNSNAQFDTNWIAPHSEYNLMSTNIWSDHAYELFCENSLTLLEKIVLMPLHVSVTVLRLKTNDIPFSSNGKWGNSKIFVLYKEIARQKIYHCMKWKIYLLLLLHYLTNWEKITRVQ